MEGMRDMPDNAFDLAIVDPPYGLGDKLTTGGTWAAKYKTGDAKWDKTPSNEYFEQLFRVSKHQIIWGGNYFSLPPTRCFLLWDKVAHMETMADCEYAWASFDKNAKIFKHVRNTSETRIHMCQKPVALYKWLLANYAKPGQTILDTHLGSGSSAIACLDYDYPITAFEIDADYFTAACERIERSQQQYKLDLAA
jgi:site-specific DNA-methyltransferase (adenine-specific)